VKLIFNNMIAANKESQINISPTEVINILKEGNKRFINGNETKKDFSAEVKGTSSGQYPLACILGCIDSRVPAEIIFDQGIGDIFNVRIAGNFVNTDILGSMEFACKVAGSKVILVLGHSQCGAVKGACDGVKLGNLTSMLSNFDQVINSNQYSDGERNSQNGEYVHLIAESNVKNTIEKIRTESPVLKEMEDNGEIKIIGGMYYVSNGTVEFY
tara:strand:+ start:143 stop:784 length:642 start_codon:yes stop_codon:yes gene_type:complete